MIISVASGKGGTGKTTVATNLAYTLADPKLEFDVRLLDCDVEAPNAHLFLKPEINYSETVYTAVPQIDEQKCTYCRKCAEICRYRAIAVLGETILTFPELCHSCGGCMAVCPENAITETGRELGRLERGRRETLSVVHGRLRVGEAMSPPLIRQVRTHIDADRVNIIDAPPGTSCPVIAAMQGVDYILLVTEPTPFGLHDLQLAVEAVKLLNIPHGLVINRSDMGDRRVIEYAAEQQLPVLLEIPFDRRIAEAYSRGSMIVETLPEWRKHFFDLYGQIEKRVAGDRIENTGMGQNVMGKKQMREGNGSCVS